MKAVNTMNAKGIQISLIRQIKKINGREVTTLDRGFNLFKNESLS